MEDYLYQKDLYLPIVEKLKDMFDEEWVVKRKPRDILTRNGWFWTGKH